MKPASSSSRVDAIPMPHSPGSINVWNGLQWETIHKWCGYTASKIPPIDGQVTQQPWHWAVVRN